MTGTTTSAGDHYHGANTAKTRSLVTVPLGMAIGEKTIPGGTSSDHVSFSGASATDYDWYGVNNTGNAGTHSHSVSGSTGTAGAGATGATGAGSSFSVMPNYRNVYAWHRVA